MTQKEIDSEKRKLTSKRVELEKEIYYINCGLNRLRSVEKNLDDPYALIPKSCKTMEDWTEGHPFPKSCLSMVFKNRTEAEDVQRSSNTYTFDYHVVKYFAQ